MGERAESTWAAFCRQVSSGPGPWGPERGVWLSSPAGWMFVGGPATALFF